MYFSHERTFLCMYVCMTYLHVLMAECIVGNTTSMYVRMYVFRYYMYACCYVWSHVYMPRMKAWRSRHTYIHTYIHTYMHIYIYEYVPIEWTLRRSAWAYIHTYIYTHTCISEVKAFGRSAWARWRCEKDWAHIHTYIHIHVPVGWRLGRSAWAYIHTYIYTHTCTSGVKAWKVSLG